MHPYLILSLAVCLACLTNASPVPPPQESKEFHNMPSIALTSSIPMGHGPANVPLPAPTTSVPRQATYSGHIIGPLNQIDISRFPLDALTATAHGLPSYVLASTATNPPPIQTTTNPDLSRHPSHGTIPTTLPSDTPRTKTLDGSYSGHIVDEVVNPLTWVPAGGPVFIPPFTTISGQSLTTLTGVRHDPGARRDFSTTTLPSVPPTTVTATSMLVTIAPTPTPKPTATSTRNPLPYQQPGPLPLPADALPQKPHEDGDVMQDWMGPGVHDGVVEQVDGHDEPPRPTGCDHHIIEGAWVCK
ncbi:MAG: hypothetical protein Q9181_006784 [Wetmoreana brouardii]